MRANRRTFLKRLGLGVAGLNLVSSFPYGLSADAAGVRQLPRGTPEAQGVSSAAILAFLAAIAESKHEFHSFIMVRHGHVIAEGWWAPYRKTARHMLYSLSKSFTSTAVGFAVTDGKLTVEDPVTSFFPDKLPAEVSDNLTSLRVKHLLTMSVGHAKDSTPIITKEQDWVKSFLSLPIANAPGSAFLYNSGATYMLSAIVQKLTGQRVIDFLRPRLFEPLKIEGMTWEICPRGINTGGWGLSVQTDSIAKFAQFYLQKGDWNGHQVLPAAWIEQATTFKIQQPAAGGADLEKMKQTSDWHQGYCYQFWRCRHNAFRGDGAFGQYAIVMPEQDAVIAITSETGNMQGELNLIWEHLLPAMKDAVLPADAASLAELRQRLAALGLPPPVAQTHSPTVARISGRKFQIDSNAAGVQTVQFDFPGDGSTFTLTDATGAYAIRCGLEKWADGESNMPGTPPKLTVGELRPLKIAASGTWKDENTFVMTWRYYETPHHDTLTAHFDGDNVKVEYLSSIAEKSASRTDSRAPLTGRVV
jgi:CubicO group peptidase (beta-lactamase class C family)